jgi:hypothetical protein
MTQREQDMPSYPGRAQPVPLVPQFAQGAGLVECLSLLVNALLGEWPFLKTNLLGSAFCLYAGPLR